MRPVFVTGASAKVVLNGVTLAYCADLSYRVEVSHAIPRVLGMYEGVSLEPLGYSVSGSFSVVRYVDGAKSALSTSPVRYSTYQNTVGNAAMVQAKQQAMQSALALPQSTPQEVIARDQAIAAAVAMPIGTEQTITEVFNTIEVPLNNGGNGLGNIAEKGHNPATSNGKRIYDQLVPASLEAGTTFNIEVYQKVNNKLLAVARIRNARIARAEASLNKRSAMIERYTFVALYLDEDSFTANPSGYFGSGNRYEQGEQGK